MSADGIDSLRNIISKIEEKENKKIKNKFEFKRIKNENLIENDVDIVLGSNTNTILLELYVTMPLYMYLDWSTMFNKTERYIRAKYTSKYFIDQIENEYEIISDHITTSLNLYNKTKKESVLPQSMLIEFYETGYVKDYESKLKDSEMLTKFTYLHKLKSILDSVLSQ